MSGSGRLVTLLVVVTLAVGLVAASGNAAPGPTAAAGGVRATLLVDPLEVVLTPPRTVRAGQRTQVVATIRNVGVAPIDDVAAVLHVSGDVAVLDGTVRELGTIRAGRQVRASWQVCSDVPSNQLVLARAEATLGETRLAQDSDAELVVIGSAGRRGPRCP